MTRPTFGLSVVRGVRTLRSAVGVGAAVAAGGAGTAVTTTLLVELSPKPLLANVYVPGVVATRTTVAATRLPGARPPSGHCTALAVSLHGPLSFWAV
jgi:hypothetical protein